MTFSSLISGTIPHHNKYGIRPGRVTRVIEHHWAGTAGGIERLSNPTQKASATYLVLSDGRILGQVPEEFRPWTSGGAAADNPSITIECQNSTGAPDYRVSDAAFNSIVRLLADIAKRHGFGALTRINYRGHREFASTACPGPYLWPRLQSVCDAANGLRAGQIGNPLGHAGTVPGVVPITPPTPLTEDDMSAQFEADVRAELLRQSLRDESFIGDVRSDLTVKGQQIAATSDTLAALDRDVRDDLVVKGNQIAAIAEAVARITVGGIDIDVLARAVNDDAARRLAS